jgi:predicted nucleic acid-binding Zn ribbon protein
MPNTKYPCTKCGKPHDSRHDECLDCRSVTCEKCGHKYAPRKRKTSKPRQICTQCLLSGGHYSSAYKKRKKARE